MNAFLLWGIFVGSALLIIVFTGGYLILMVSRHNKRRNTDWKLIFPDSNEQKGTDNKRKFPDLKGYKLPNSIIILYASVLDRRQSSITNYLIFQVTTKMFGFTGVLYSLYGFLLNFFKESEFLFTEFLSTLVSFVSLVFVILALYLSPERRISEYMIAWRKYDKLATDIIGKLPLYDGKRGDCPLILKDVENISKEISEIEGAITSDES